MGFAILCLSLLYSIFLNLLFFSKKHIKTYETKIFGIMLVSNLVGILLEFSCIGLIFSLGTENLFVILINKLFLVYLLTFGLLFTLYAAYISLINNIEEDLSKKHNLIRKIGIILGIIFSVFIYILPIKLYSENGVMYSSGPSANVVYLFSTLGTIVCTVMMVMKYRNIPKKKFALLLIYIIGCGIIAMIQQMNPQLTLATTMETFIIFLMFNTIENPDVKMIEELNLAKDEADKANNAKTEFLSSMSHEIRTPLNAIVGFSDCILESETLSEAKDNAADIVNASETLLEIVNGILDISKIEAGKIEIVTTKYNAPNTYLELAKLISPKMAEKGLDFSYNIAPDLPDTLLGDHSNIKKIVTNLLSNACKYTDRGFVHYEVNCVNSNGVCKLIISVEDSGRGIKKESMDKMFTKFQRLDEDRNTTIEGTGLGLAITKQLTELMGGRIIVHTVYGQGSKFTVVINQKIEKSDGVEHKSVKTTLDLTDVRLLVVDDNQLNLKVATKLFEKFNANHIITCESGFDCIDKIKRGEEYDVILLDDMMPKMSGVETLAELKKIPEFNIPVVALTANAITGMKEKYLADGFDDYLAKPIEKNEFIRVMNELLGRSNTEVIEPIVEKPEPVVSSLNVRDEIIVPEDKIPNIIPVEDNIEEMLGSKLELSKETVIEPVIETLEVDHIETLEENIRDEIIIPDLVPIADINISNNTNNNVCVVYDRSYLENNGVDINHALELLGDMEMYNMTIGDFMKEIDDKWNCIITCRDNRDMPNYAIDVHSLKSDCKYLGFMTLADISYQHELKSKENDVEFVLEHFKELEDEYHKMYKIAKTYADNNPVAE